MSYYEPGRSEHWRFVVGLLAGLLLVSTVWAVQVLLEPDEQPDSGAPASSSFRPEAEQTTASTPPSVQETCREVFAMQTESLTAGGPALAQWQVHIGAMNRLVTGVISLEQATAFWDDTRRRARALLDRYDAAQEAYAVRTSRCPGSGSVGDREGLVRCAAAVSARHLAVRALAVTLGTWDEHVRHMEMLRHGHLSPERAATLWLASWQAGMDEVREYRDAKEAAAGMRCAGDAGR